MIFFFVLSRIVSGFISDSTFPVRPSILRVLPSEGCNWCRFGLKTMNSTVQRTAKHPNIIVFFIVAMRGIRAVSGNADKFPFWRLSTMFDFEGWRNRPKYKLIIMAQPCGDCEQLRKKNSESPRGSSFRLFLCIWTKGFVYGHTRNLNRGLIKTHRLLRKISIYVFNGGCRRRALNKYKAFRAIRIAWKTGIKLIWQLPRGIGKIQPLKA